MSDDAYGWASSWAFLDISRQVGPPSASTLTSSRRSASLGANSPNPESTTKSTFGDSWPGRNPVMISAWPGFRHRHVGRAHELRHVFDETQNERWSREAVLGQSATQLLVSPADDNHLPLKFVCGEGTHLLLQVAYARAAAHHQHGESFFVEAEAAAERLLLARRRRAEAKVNREPEQLDAVGRNPPAQGHLAGKLRRRDHEVGPAEGPAAMKVDQVRDHCHQRAWPVALANRLVADVIQEGVHGEDHVGVVVFQQLDHRFAHAMAEHGADRREGGSSVARVIDGAPRRTRPPDHRRVERRESFDHRRALSDQRI